MIDLTPLEVRLKKGDFRRGFRGYDVELVDDFLDLISDRMEELVKQNRALGESVQALESEVAAYRNKERALSDALMTAQRLREDAKAHAQKEGELMVREARMAAEAAREEASRALVREEQAFRQARARRAQLIASFRRLLQHELSELDVIEEALELKADEDAALPEGADDESAANPEATGAAHSAGGRASADVSDSASVAEPKEAGDPGPTAPPGKAGPAARSKSETAPVEDGRSS